MIRLVVLGTPVTQGSKRAFVNRHTGRAAVVESNAKELRPWREAIRSEAQRAVEAGAAMLDGPVDVGLFFGLPKPAAAPKKKRTFPIKARSGDLDKLCRSALDACTGILWADDSQVVSLTLAKDYSRRPGLIAVVRPHAPDHPVLWPGATRELDAADQEAEPQEVLL